MQERNRAERGCESGTGASPSPGWAALLTGLCAVLLCGALLAGCASRPRDLDTPTAIAIEAAMTIDYPTDRLDVLHRIAKRRDLIQAEQIYLVDAICQIGGFGSQQADALITLIENPCCTTATRDHITEKLRWTRMGSEKVRVVDALLDSAPRDSSQNQPADQSG